LAGLRPYSPGKPVEELRRERGLDRIVKLASNENPLGSPPLAMQAMRRASERAHIYPDAAGHDLRAALAERTGLPPEQIVAGNGSDELIHLLGLAFLAGPDDQLVMGSPSFVRYEAAAGLAEAELTAVPLDGDWRHDIDAMIAALTPRTRLVFIANPNNPTGTIITQAEADRMAEALPSGALLVLDEAYHEYAAGSGCADAVAMVRSGAPVAALRTFSKAYGLAGLRVGWGAFPAEAADALNRIREPFNVNVLAQAAAVGALQDQDFLDRSIRANREGGRRIAEHARGLGLPVIEGFANFVCVEVGDGRSAAEGLLDEGVIVRSGHVLGMPKHIRVSIGTAEEIEAYCAALERTLARTGARA
jgi:histidinol-phosphate aminotransferase